MLNAAARFVYGLRRYEPVSDALMSLLWLRMERIQFKLAVLIQPGPSRRCTDLPRAIPPAV